MSLTIGGVTVPVSSIDEQAPLHIGGSYLRTFSGAIATQSRGTKKIFNVTTTWMKSAAYDTLRAKIDLVTDQTIGGTFVPFTTGRTQLTRSGRLRDSDGSRQNMTFTLMES